MKLLAETDTVHHSHWEWDVPGARPYYEDRPDEWGGRDEADAIFSSSVEVEMGEGGFYG